VLNYTVTLRSFRKRTTKKNWKWLWRATGKHCVIKLIRKTYRSLSMHSSSKLHNRHYDVQTFGMCLISSKR